MIQMQVRSIMGAMITGSPADEKKMRIRAEIYENVRALELNRGTLSHCSSRIDQWGQWGFTNWGVRLFICGGDRAQGG